MSDIFSHLLGASIIENVDELFPDVFVMPFINDTPYEGSEEQEEEFAGFYELRDSLCFNEFNGWGMTWNLSSGHLAIRDGMTGISYYLEE